MPLAPLSTTLFLPDSGGRPAPSAQGKPVPPQFAEQLRAVRADKASSPSPQQTVRRERTVLTGNQAASALANAWQQTTGHAPSRGTTAILTAQWAHETGRGRAMMNFNFGGIKGVGPTGLTATYATREGSGDAARHLRDGFRAYESAEQGAEDYLSLLSRRYPAALEAAKNQDPAAFVDALHQGGYFTDAPEAYTRSVSLLSAQALQHGFDAIGATATTPTQALPTAKTEQLASRPTEEQSFAHTTTPEAITAQAFLAEDAVSRIALLLSQLPLAGSRTPSSDSDGVKG